MAHPLLALPAAAAMAAALQGGQAPTQSSHDQGRLIVEWRTQTFYPEEQKVVFRGDVKATYGVTVLTCETLTIFIAEDKQTGIAEGDVHIDDPEGMAEAARVVFNWRDRTGEADRAVVRVDMMTLEAEKVQIHPDRYELTNVQISECGVRTPLLRIWSPNVVIRPGKDTVARRVTVSILGQKIATLRRQELTGSSGDKGIRLPSISVRRGAGLGVTWQAGVPTTGSTYTDFRLAAFPNRRPSSTLTISRSLLNPDRVEALLTPRSDLSELFNYGYLENINVEKPEDERNYLSRNRLTVSVASVHNVGVSGRTSSDSINKPYEIVLEQGGATGGFAMINQLRYQNINIRDRDGQRRLVAISSLLSPALRLSENLELMARGDGRWYFNEDSESGWGRLSTELIYRPSENVRIGAGYSFGSNRGDFAFEFDALPRESTYHIRTDFLLGPTRVYALGKYDPHGREWWDFEFAIYQLAGCFEPYYIYRQFPGTSSFGIKFRVFEAFDRLRDRIPQRTRANTIPIGSAPPPRPHSMGDGWKEDVLWAPARSQSSLRSP